MLVGFELKAKPFKKTGEKAFGRREFEWESICVEKDLFGKLLGRIEFDWKTICIELGSNRIRLAKYLRRDRSASNFLNKIRWQSLSKSVKSIPAPMALF